MARRILHIDLDAFFCSVEEILNPSLKGKPFAVGGNPRNRGVVASCSYPARMYGIRSAMPMAKALRLCPQLIVLPGHYTAYTYYSHKVMGVLKASCQMVEQVSIDEAFLDISNIQISSLIFAQNLQEKIKNDLDLPCSIGIATNKLVAKIATEVGKAASPPGIPPNAIQIVPPGYEREFLAPLPIEWLCGVGPKIANQLKNLKFNTIGELSEYPERELIKLLGKIGYELSRKSKGVDDQPLIPTHTIKSISKERTFACDLIDKELLSKVLEALSSDICHRLKKARLVGRTIKLKIRYSDFQTITRQISLQYPTNNQETVEQIIKRLFEDTWTSSTPVRLLGIGVSSLVPSKHQLSLWDLMGNQTLNEKEQQLHKVLDDLQKRFGQDCIHLGIS